MKKIIKSILTGLIILMPSVGLFGLLTPSVADADTLPMSEVNQSTSDISSLPHVTDIETGNFTYVILKPIGVQTLTGISPLMLINPDHKFHHSDVKVTMSDGSTLLRYNDGLFVNASQVETHVLR